MKLLGLFLFFLTLVTGLAVSSFVADDIIRSDLPADGRFRIDRHVEARPIEPRRIGSRSLESRQAVPGRYIIEFKEGYTHDAFRSYLKENNVAYKFTSIYNTPDIFVGVAIQLENYGADYAKVASWEGVGNITPVHIITLPPQPPDEPVSNLIHEPVSVPDNA